MSSENDFLSFLNETEDFQPLTFASDCDTFNFANASPPQQPTVTYAPSDVFLTNPEISPSNLNNVVFPQFTSAQPFQFQGAQAFAFPYVAVPQVVGFPVTTLAPAQTVTVVSPTYSATSSSSASSASSSPTPTTSSPKRKPKDKADKVRKVKEEDSDDKPKKRRKRLDDEVEQDKSMLQALLSKPNNALTREEKEKKRVLRNRQSAQKSREKKKQEVEVLSIENDKLRSENDLLKQRVSELEQEVDNLKDKLLQYGVTETDSMNSAAPPPPLSLLLGEAPRAVALFVVLFCVGLFVFSGMGPARDRGNTALPSKIDNELIVKSEMKHGRTILNTTENQDDITIVYNSEEEQKTYFKESKTKYGLSNSDNTKFTENEELAMEVNFDDMEKTKFYYPKEMKKHFTFSNKKKDSQKKCGEDEPEPTTIEVPEQAANDTTVETAAADPHIGFNATSDSTESSLNETVMVGGPLITVKDKTTVDMTNFEKGYLYHISTEEDATTGKKTIFFFCPFSYPLLPPPSADGTENPAQDVSIKIYIPDKSVHNTNDKFSKVLRVAEITAEKLSLHEAFFAFPNEFRVKKPKNGTASAA